MDRRFALIVTKAKLKALKRDDSLLKRILLRDTYNKLRSGTKKPIQKVQINRQGRSSKVDEGSYEKLSLYNPELLRCFNLLESMYDSDYDYDNESDYVPSNRSTSPYIYSGEYRSEISF